MTIPANVPPRLTVGDTVTIDAPGEKYHGMIGRLAEDDGTDLPYFVRFQTGGAEWFTPNQVLRSDLAPAADLVSIEHTTTVTLRRPVTALQLAIGAAAIDSDWPVTVHTYADHIKIIGTHETKEN